MMTLLPVLLATVAVPPAPAGAFVLNRTVEAGEVLADADFRMQPGPAPANVLSPHQAGDREAIRRLPEGALVHASDVRAPQQVKRGDPVLIAIRSGPLTITSQGRALSGGGMGDEVRVTSDATRRTLMATVEGPRRVAILAE